jgi:tetratricopeptide (TPR) repeat protein
MILNSLSIIYNATKREKTAEGMYLKILDIYKFNRIENDFMVPYTEHNLACYYQKISDFTRAKMYHEQCIPHYANIQGPDSDEVAMATNNLGLTCEGLNENADAEKHFKRSMDLYEKMYSANHPKTKASMRSLIRIYRKTQQEDAAKALEERLNHNGNSK